jgi:putative FmdB family regulatory protein
LEGDLPLYEYQCGRCGRFEIIRKFSDAPLTGCPTCGQEVQKLLSAPAIQFKGTGWYITDYARKSSGGEASKDGGGKANPSSGAGKDSGTSKDGGKGGSGEAASAAPSTGSSADTSSTTAKPAKTGSGSST